MKPKLWMLTLTFVLAACSAPADPAPTEPGPAQPQSTASASQPVANSEPTATSEAVTTAPDPTATTAPKPAAPTEDDSYGQPASASQTFVKMEVGVTGSATADTTANVVRFSDDFNISDGPDLHVILSSANNLALDFVSFSSTVTAADILYLGELKNLSGAQDYAIPAGTDLSQYNSVIVWCKQYSVAFAAALLR